jgi:hypothetical protein
MSTSQTAKFVQVEEDEGEDATYINSAEGTAHFRGVHIYNKHHTFSLNLCIRRK